MLAIDILQATFSFFIVLPLFPLGRKSAAAPEPIEGIVQITSREVEPRRNWIHTGLILISILFFVDNVLLLRRAESGIVSQWVFLESGAIAFALAATLCAVRDRYRGRALLWLLVVAFIFEAVLLGLTLPIQLREHVNLPSIILPAIRLALYIGTLVAVSSPAVRYTSHVQPTESSNLLSATGAEQTYGSAGSSASASRQGRQDVEGYIVPDSTSSSKAMQSLDVCVLDPAPQGCAPSLDHRHPTMLSRKQNVRSRSRSPSSSSPSPPMITSDLPSVIPISQREKRRSFNVYRGKLPPSAGRTGSGSSEGKGKERERAQEAITITQYQASASSQGHGGSASDSSDATEVERETNRLLEGLRAQTDDPRRRKATAPPPIPTSSPGPLRHQPYHVRRSPQVAHPLPAKKTILPISLQTPFGHVQITRRRGEDFLIVSAITGAVVRLGPGMHEWAVAGEMSVLVVLSIVYVSFRSVRQPPKPVTVRPARQSFSQTVTPSPDGRLPDEPGSRGRVWGTDDKDYRECPDDGAITALLLGPLLAASLLVSTIERKRAGDPPLPGDWMIEQPLVVRSTPIYDPSNPSSREPGGDALSALAFSRRNLVQLTTLLSFVLLVQIMWSRRAELRFLRRSDQDSTSSWIPRREWRRSLTVIGFALVVTSGCVVVQSATKAIGGAIWSDLSFSDVVIASLFYQFSLYVCVRLARRGFTLGELGIVCHAATTLFMETVNVTRNKIRVLQTPYIKTYRLPTPLLAFQLALIPGSLLAGFLLSPLLVLARNIAQKPVHRLRYPREKEIHRRVLAAGFYIGAAIVCVGIVGTWVQWCIQWRNPWMWVVRWLLLGTHPWTRPVLIAYWGLLAVISVAAWTRQLARARRQRPRSQAPLRSPVAGQNISAVATQVMDAADQRLPTLSVNARRKFFHALAVIMFVPGIAFDPAFTHLSFSLAFAAFTFAEYIRYFALWPFGANVHLFLNEFLDHKDSGTAILSHFYLLTGCAGPLWLESSSQIMSYFGVLSLGVGDALASILGRRMGHVRWSTANGKTLEGSVAFAASVLLSSSALWATGLVADFKPYAYTTMVILTSVLEALSAQNDNLILPLYGWCVGTLLGV